MTILTTENNRNTAPNFRELDISEIGAARIPHVTNMIRSEIMAKLITKAYVNMARFMRRANISPAGRFLARRRTMNELSGLSDRTLADIGIRRINITTVTEDSYLMYIA